MRKIDVCLSPDMIHLYDVAGHAVVVVDILRATSCMVTAIAHGVDHIAPVAALDDCRAMKSQGYLISGERDGSKVEGFDFGNSPFEYQHEHIRGRQIAFTTTNGTQAIARSMGAKELIIGAFLNLSAVVAYLQKLPYDVLVVCAGWKGKVNLEDSLFAGALVNALKPGLEAACDAPLAAEHLYNAGRADLLSFLKESSHVKRLSRLNITEDVKFCLTHDAYDVVPVVRNARIVSG